MYLESRPVNLTISVLIETQLIPKLADWMEFPKQSVGPA